MWFGNTQSPTGQPGLSAPKTIIVTCTIPPNCTIPDRPALDYAHFYNSLYQFGTLSKTNCFLLALLQSLTCPICSILPTLWSSEWSLQLIGEGSQTWPLAPDSVIGAQWHFTSCIHYINCPSSPLVCASWFITRTVILIRHSTKALSKKSTCLILKCTSCNMGQIGPC